MFKRFKGWVSGHKRLTILSAILFFLLVSFGTFLIIGQKYYPPIYDGIVFSDITDVFDGKEEDEKDLAEDDAGSEGLIQDLELDFLGTPMLVSKQFNLTNPGEDGRDSDNEIKEVYKTADVLNGTYGGDSLKGCEVFLLKYSSWLFEARIISCDNEKVFLIGSYQVEAGFPYDNPAENFVEIPSTDYPETLFTNLPASDGALISDSGNSYDVWRLRFELYKKSELVEVDKIKGLSVYDIVTDGKGEFLVSSPEGFYEVLVINPGIVSLKGDANYPEVTIKLNNGDTFSAIYDYISIGGCFDNYLEVADVKIADLTKVGTGINGESIYEDTDRNATYLKKVYSEDYARKDGVHTWNDIKDDDTTPYSYGKFSESYPVIYWVDPFDRVIKFARRDFISTGGCAKPAIYLYSDKTIDLNVKVIPNGHLTFTLPKYPVSGWDVTASKSGSVQYRNSIYPYLWWESTSYGYATPKEGWVIKKKDAQEKIGEVLFDYGLNQTEVEDFIRYWIPIIEREESEYLFFTFLVDNQVNQIAKLEFSIEPENILRLFMIYKPLEDYEEIAPLEIEKVQRKGFTVIEWGGAKY